MGKRSMTVCLEPTCPQLAPKGRSRCPDHDAGPWAGSDRASRLPANWASEIRPRILERDGHRCTWMEHGMRCPAAATEVDHITAGDDHSDGNLRALCTPHHARKTAADANKARWSRTQGGTPSPR